MAQIQHLYSDIDLKLTKNPITKDISASYDEQAVIRSIRNLIMTKPYERLFQPTLGSSISEILFEPITPLTSGLLQDEITRTINNWEPRCKIATIDISSYPDQNAYQVSMFFYVGNSTTPTGINLILQRDR